MKEETEPTLKSSANQFVEFLDSTVWADIKSELNIWLEGVRDGLENPESDEKDLYRNQGRAEAIRYVLSLPETIKEQLIEEQTKEEEPKDGRES
jgi:hypothetical protein